MYNQPSHEMKCDSMLIILYSLSNRLKTLQNELKLQKIIHWESYIGARTFSRFCKTFLFKIELIGSIQPENFRSALFSVRPLRWK